MTINHYLQLSYGLEKKLRENLIKTAEYHKTEHDIYYECQDLASISDEHRRKIEQLLQKYPVQKANEPGTHFRVLLEDHNTGLNLLNDLHYLWLLTVEMQLIRRFLLQSAENVRDADLEDECRKLEEGSEKQSDWLLKRINHIMSHHSVLEGSK